jgi:hypothetical protein
VDLIHFRVHWGGLLALVGLSLWDLLTEGRPLRVFIYLRIVYLDIKCVTVNNNNRLIIITVVVVGLVVVVVVKCNTNFSPKIQYTELTIRISYRIILISTKLNYFGNILIIRIINLKRCELYIVWDLNPTPLMPVVVQLHSKNRN